MRSRLVILAAVMTAVAAVAAVIISFAPSPGPPGPAVAQATLSTGAASYMAGPTRTGRRRTTGQSRISRRQRVGS